MGNSVPLGFIDGEYQDGELRGCTFVAGDRGMGKTTEMSRLLEGCAGGVVMFDTLSRHETVLPGFRLISQPGHLETYLRANRGRRFQVLYQPRSGELDDHFRAVCVIVRAFGWMIFGIDELDLHCGPRWGDSRMPKEFYHLVHFGRHARVSMLATARTPPSVARGYTSQCSEMRLFHMSEENYLKYFENRIGRANAAILPTLPKYRYLHWRDGAESTIEGGKK